MPLMHQDSTETEIMVKNPTSGGAYTARKQQERHQQDPVSRTGTPSQGPFKPIARRNSAASLNSASDSHSIGTEDERLRKIQCMKLPMKPNFQTNHITSKYNNLQQQENKAPRTSTFDDTTNISDWDDSSIPLEEDENRTTVFRGLNAQTVDQGNTNKLAKPLATRIHNVAGMQIITGKNIEAELNEARQAQAAGKFGSSSMPFGPKRGPAGIHAQAQDNSEARDEDYIQAAIAQDTPSRPQSVPSHLRHIIQLPKSVAFQQLSPSLNSKDLAQEDDDNQGNREDSPELQMPSAQRQQVFNMGTSGVSHQPATETFGASESGQIGRLAEQNPKSVSGHVWDQFSTDRTSRADNRTNIPIRSTSEFPTTMGHYNRREDERQSTESREPLSPSTCQRELSLNRKRSRETELDYNDEDLRKKTYEELNKEAFTTDPRLSTSETAVDAQGNTMTLSQRLTNLSKMREEDQKNMLRSQTDDEWTQTGLWFIDKLQEDLKKLMDARLERRKISMKYEDHVRRRQKDIEWSASNLDKELRELKNGGGKLIEGKKSTSRISTPRK